MTAVPDVKWFLLGPEDEFAILASDGLWDVIQNKEAVELVQNHLRLSDWQKRNRARLAVIAKEAADLLVNTAVKKLSMDNITALVLLFPWH